MNTSPTKEQMEYTQNNLFQIAKIALVQRKFQVALDNAEKGLYNVARSTLPLDPDNMCGKISLRHTTCGKYGSDAVAFSIIYMQAWYELENRVDRIRTDADLKEFEQGIIFIPLYYLRHLRSAMPFLVSVVWLKLIIAMGKLQEAKKEITNYLQTSEASLYMQGHWEAVAKREGPITEKSSVTTSGKERYGELIEILCLNILIPLGEKTVALSYLSTCAIGDKKKIGIYQTVQNMPDIKPRKIEIGKAALESKHEDEDNDIETKDDPDDKEEEEEEVLLEDEPITDDDVQILVLTAVGITVVAGVGYFAYRRRRNFLDSLSYGIRQFTRLLAGNQGGGGMFN